MHEILAWDAHLIYELAYVLNEQIHAGEPDLAFMYTYAEVALVTILLDMTRQGIGVYGTKAAVAYAEATRHAEALYDEITAGETINLWNGRQVYELLKRQNRNLCVPRMEITAFDLRRMASWDPLAAKILEWRELQTDRPELLACRGRKNSNPSRVGHND